MPFPKIRAHRADDGEPSGDTVKIPDNFCKNLAAGRYASTRLGAGPRDTPRLRIIPGTSSRFAEKRIFEFRARVGSSLIRFRHDNRAVSAHYVMRPTRARVGGAQNMR
jgi:hypothetical protein